ncbi:MAG: guanylate kinase [Chlamydiia bacterium]|nr:guanylate kinase [Chlamydiia bacterium]
MTPKLVGNAKRGKLFVLSAPAGTGKTTLVKMLTGEFNSVLQSISYTSRKPRPGETDGVDYNFVDKEQFNERLGENAFLEHAQVYEDFYGTDKRWVEEKLGEGKHVFLVIDTQGALTVMQKVPCVSIFVFPPSLEELHQRLEHRGTESDAALAQRLEWSRREITKAPYYQYHILNDDLSVAYEVLRSIVIAEDHKQEKIHGI